MALAVHPKTYDDLCRAREGGDRYELIEGELVLVASPSPRHQWGLQELFAGFRRAVTRTGIGYVFIAPLDVRLGPHTYVQPDLLVILNEREHLIGESMIEGAPNLVVEVLSRNSRASDRGRKLEVYAKAGVPECWLIDLAAQTILIHTEPEGNRYARVEQATEIARATVVPDLAIEVASLRLGR